MGVTVVSPTNQGELFNGDFSPAGGPVTAAGTHQYTNPPTFDGSPSDVQIYTAATTPDLPPPPPLDYFARHTLHDSSITGASGRTQLVSPYFARTGEEVGFEGWDRMRYVPSVGAGQFFLIWEIFGPPFFGSPSMSLTVDQSGNLAFASEQPSNPPQFFDDMWHTPLAPLVNSWFHWRVEALMSTDQTVGWCKFGIATDGTDNDVWQSLTINGNTSTQLTMQTLNWSGTNNARGIQAGLYPDLYRSKGLETVSTVDHAGYRAYTP